MQASGTLMPTRSRAASGWVVPLALFVACALLYSINLGRMAHPDEYYHILAAHGLLATGEPRIAEGIYTRVYLHTWLVAQSFALFGESLPHDPQRPRGYTKPDELLILSRPAPQHRCEQQHGKRKQLHRGEPSCGSLSFLSSSPLLPLAPAALECLFFLGSRIHENTSRA